MSPTAERLKILRDEKDLSQDEMANILNIDRTTYLKYEKTGKVPTIKLTKLAKFFNVSTDYLLGLTDIEQKKEPDNIMPGISLKNNIELSADEEELIKKYRQLPADRQETVKLILDNQVNAVIQSEEAKLRNA